LSTTSITVVLPTFGDRQGLLDRALRSIASAGDGCHVVVVDDATPDSSVRRVVERFPDFLYVRRELNGGVAAAQNSGLERVDTEFVCFLHSDDLLAEGRFQAQLAAMSSSTDVVGSAAKVGDAIIADNVHALSAYQMAQFDCGWVHISPYLFRTEAIGKTRFDEALRAWEDFDFLLQLKIAGVRFATCDSIGCYVMDDGLGRLSTLAINADALIHLWAKHQPLLGNRRTRAIWQFKIGRNLQKEGRLSDGRRWIVHSLSESPLHPRRALKLFFREPVRREAMTQG
jgi:glycosyltransferase involved in cell wall biosynthesis